MAYDNHEGACHDVSGTLFKLCRSRILEAMDSVTISQISGSSRRAQLWSHRDACNEAKKCALLSTGAGDRKPEKNVPRCAGTLKCADLVAIHNLLCLKEVL